MLLLRGELIECSSIICWNRIRFNMQIIELLLYYSKTQPTLLSLLLLCHWLSSPMNQPLCMYPIRTLPLNVCGLIELLYCNSSSIIPWYLHSEYIYPIVIALLLSDPPTCNNATVNPVYALNIPSGNRTFAKSAKFEEKPCPLYEELDINLGMQAEYFSSLSLRFIIYYVSVCLFLTNRKQPIHIWEASQHISTRHINLFWEDRPQ